MTKKNRLSIDLFVGAGGLTTGFKSAGFRSLYANDFDTNAARTCKFNHPKTQVEDVSIESVDASALREQLGLNRGDLDALIGGPPCQGFSTYGKRDSADQRNQLYLHFIRFLEEFQPKTYLIENVTGLLSMSGGAVLEDIERLLIKSGYGVSVYVLDAADYGVPQRRKRVFIVGALEGVTIPPPSPTHASPDTAHQGDFLKSDFLQPHVTVRDAIDDLSKVEPFPPSGANEPTTYPDKHCRSHYQRKMVQDQCELLNHSTKQMLGIRRLRLSLMKPGDYGSDMIDRIAENGLSSEAINDILSGSRLIRDINKCRGEDIKKEKELRKFLTQGHHNQDELMGFLDSGGFANKYRRLKWDQPSHTLVAHMARDCSDFVHPDQDRFVSVREAARLQSFPDSIQFTGSQFQQFKQIGNAVPPLLAQALAEKLLQYASK